MITVLLIHMGGTLGMVKNNDYYVVQSKILIENIKNNKLLNVSTFSGGLIYKNSKNQQVNYDIYENKIIDSSNANANYYLEILKIIKDNYDNYDSFIVIHGTDTLAYSASTISFLIENLNKIIIFTGSMIPLIEANTDAVDNLIGSFETILNKVNPNVYIYFNKKLLIGNRSTKINSCSNDGFLCKSNNYSHNFTGKTKFYEKLKHNIEIIEVHPFMCYESVEMIFKSSKAVIIKSYGSGNVSEQLLKLIRKYSNEILIFLISKCLHGRINGNYEVSHQLLTTTNVINGNDMTMEAALAKVSFVLGNYDLEEAKILITKNLRGEITI